MWLYMRHFRTGHLPGLNLISYAPQICFKAFKRRCELSSTAWTMDLPNAHPCLSEAENWTEYCIDKLANVARGNKAALRFVSIDPAVTVLAFNRGPSIGHG